MKNAGKTPQNISQGYGDYFGNQYETYASFRKKLSINPLESTNKGNSVTVMVKQS